MLGEARIALAALLTGATAIGFAPILVRLSELGPIATAFYRLFLALPLLGLWWWLDRRRDGMPRRLARRWHWLVAAGLFFAADLAVWHWSIRLTSVANATFLANLAPLFVTLAGMLVFGERYGARFFAGLALALAGAATLMAGGLALGAQRWLGDGLGVLTAVFYAGYIVSVARLRADTSSATIMLASAAVSAAALLPLALVSGENLWPARAEGWLTLLALAAVSHVAGQGLITWALKHLRAAFGSVGLLWQPVAAALLAWALLGEALGALTVTGGVLVLAGIFTARRAEPNHRGSS
jgi:drug/metabolite transporter (DMT)-like permease